MARVLVVDDEPGVRTAVARGLTAEGMDVVAVGDGQSALRAALTGSFDAVVLDIILPGLSGYRVLERLRSAGVDTPVLLLSAPQVCLPLTRLVTLRATFQTYTSLQRVREL